MLYYKQVFKIMKSIMDLDDTLSYTIVPSPTDSISKIHVSKQGYYKRHLVLGFESERLTKSITDWATTMNITVEQLFEQEENVQEIRDLLVNEIELALVRKLEIDDEFKADLKKYQLNKIMES